MVGPNPSGGLAGNLGGNAQPVRGPDSQEPLAALQPASRDWTHLTNGPAWITEDGPGMVGTRPSEISLGASENAPAH